jgi:UDP-N-acetylglucosamine 3-dehydrogenase
VRAYLWTGTKNPISGWRMVKKLKVGVIGIGNMGSAHARIYSQLKECELVGICDTDPRKKYLAEKYRCKFFTNSKEFVREEMDAISICTPTSTHREIALETLENDKHILVEKPFTINVKSGEEIVKKSIETGRLVAVGYVERFNPAVNKLRETVDFSQIYSIVSLRFGPVTPIIRDIGVLLDLGSHEIDILNHLTNAQPEILYAYVSYNSNNKFEDYAYLSLRYNQLHSHIETSWLPEYKMRLLNLYGNERFYNLNYAQQVLKSHRAPPRIKIESGNWQDTLWLTRNVEENIQIPLEEPLKQELQNFVKCVKKGKVLDPMCNGKDAIKVLKVIEKAFARMHTSGGKLNPR